MFQFKQIAGTAESLSRARGRTLGLVLAVLVCSSCASMQVGPHAQREVLFCQGPTVEAGVCRPVDIRALERAIFGLPGQRR